MILEDFLFRLRGETVWLAGGKRVGQTVAEALAELGMNIVVSYRGSEAEARATVKQCQARGVKALAVPTDVSRKEEAEAVVRRAAEAGMPIGALVNMASVFAAQPLEKIMPQDFETNIAAHILGAFWPAQALIAEWRRRNYKGKIILFTDRTVAEGGHPYLDHLPYVVTKGATQAMVKALAKEASQWGIAVNAIAPGPLLRPPAIDDREWQVIRDAAPLKGITDNEAVRQVALAVIHLLLAELTTGSTLVLDSGFNLN